MELNADSKLVRIAYFFREPDMLEISDPTSPSGRSRVWTNIPRTGSLCGLFWRLVFAAFMVVLVTYLLGTLVWMMFTVEGAYLGGLVGLGILFSFYVADYIKKWTPSNIVSWKDSKTREVLLAVKGKYCPLITFNHLEATPLKKGG